MPKLDTPKAMRELGPGKGGASGFIAVRLNAMALIVLSAWFLTALVLLPDLSYPVLTLWLVHPLNALTLIASIAITCWHCVFTIGAAAFGIWSVARIARTPA